MAEIIHINSLKTSFILLSQIAEERTKENNPKERGRPKREHQLLEEEEGEEEDGNEGMKETDSLNSRHAPF